MPKILIVGLRISFLKGKPVETLYGNPVRSWALFEGLGRYGFDTHLFVDAGATIEPHLVENYDGRFVRDPSEAIDRANRSEFDLIVLCGTRVHEIIKNHPWITEIKGQKICAAFCYHNMNDPVPTEFLDQFVSAGFVSAHYLKAWRDFSPKTHSMSVITTGQPARPAKTTPSDGSALFMGHIHNHGKLRFLANIARADPDREYNIISSRIRGIVPSDPDQYFAISRENVADLRAMLEESVGFSTANLNFRFLPPGEEQELVDRASFAVDVTWNQAWLMDNSKVANYLVNGLPVICELPSKSYRFVERFDAGFVLPFNANVSEWAECAKTLSAWTDEQRNRLREDSGQFFSWDNLVYDISMLARAALEA